MSQSKIDNYNKFLGIDNISYIIPPKEKIFEQQASFEIYKSKMEEFIKLQSKINDG